MICSSYFDLKLRPSADDITNWDRFGRLIRALHVGATQTNVKFAIDFPEWMREGFSLGDRIRVFGSESNSLNQLYDSIEACSWFEDEVESGRIRTVKEVKGYHALLHHSFGGGVIKDRKGIGLDKIRETQAQRKMAFMAKAQSLPYIKILSSTGKQFCLRLERIHATQSDTGEPNGYGVSRPTQIIALPVLP